MIVQTLTYLEIKASEISSTNQSVQKYFTFSNRIYLLKIKKNDSGIYTIEVWNQKGTEHLFSNKITYGQAVIDSKNATFQDLIIPLNIDKLNGETNLDTINDDTLGNQIKLYTNIVES